MRLVGTNAPASSRHDHPVYAGGQQVPAIFLATAATPTAKSR